MAKLVESRVFQVETYRGDWINIKVVDLAEGEEWNTDAVRNWKPKLRSVVIVAEEDDDEQTREENEDKALKVKKKAKR